jgi:hypothetical protein
MMPASGNRITEKQSLSCVMQHAKPSSRQPYIGEFPFTFNALCIFSRAGTLAA